MPLKSSPSFDKVSDRQFELPEPAIGGLNLKDLEYEQNVDQSPYMKNMMYRNGAFSKRFGQEVYGNSYPDEILDCVMYKQSLLVHSGTKLYKDGVELEGVTLRSAKGLFIPFAQKLYYIQHPEYTEEDGKRTYTYDGGYYVYDGKEWKDVEPYIPEIVINRSPSGSITEGHTEDPTHSAGDFVEEYNLLTGWFQNTFDGDGESTDYYLYQMKDLDESKGVKIEINGEEVTDGFTVDYANAKVTFTTAPAKGDNNVKISACKTDEETTDLTRKILLCKYATPFGGNNNSCLFLGGDGESHYFWSDAYDATYFSEINYATCGNTDEDITGFGHQYNVLIVYKPREMYSLTYFVQDEKTSSDDHLYGAFAFSSQTVNAEIGCTSPDSIQLINNQLVWYSSYVGVCTLVSTNVLDERNVRPISRNINRTNNMGIVGIRDIKNETITSVDWDSKYFLVFKESGRAFVWDYANSPYHNTSRVDEDAKRLAWFFFDKFYVNQFIRVSEDKLVYSSVQDGYRNKMIGLNNSFVDYDDKGIESFYMTPFLQFGAVEYLKNVKNIYVQCRGDTASVIDMYYYTDEDIKPEHEAESIRIGGRLWHHFEWSNFQWLVVNWANTFRRKCSLKKIQMASFYFENKDKYEGDELVYNCAGRDMSITHIGLQYQLVKYIK